ncbi:MAG: TraB/GumN family protein [Chitinophagaceae bacterium]|nr:TraB/GumN family protein [Chitinophagaceae bacterium]
MKRFSAGLILSLLAVTTFAQQQKEDKTLLWKITGNGLEKPSYLFGTIHMLCKEDAFLSPQLKSAIADADKVYLELDMDNMLELLGAMMRMKMKNDTTLADLLTKDEYNRIKEYFQEHSTLLPFSVVETYKPMLAASMIMETTMVCDDQVAMEQLIMEEAKSAGKSIEGLETMAYQMSMFDSIPYKVQAKALLKGISSGKDETAADKEFQALLKAYKEQDLEKLGKMISQSEDEMMQYDDLLLNNRNRNWVEKLKKLMPQKSLVVAVGAGHLPGEKGVIALLRLAGYTVTPMENKIGKPSRTI